MTALDDDTIDLADPRARAAWAAPTVTPEREDAWQRWVWDYAVQCGIGYVQNGASQEDAAVGVTNVVLDLRQIDDRPWMPLGEALSHKLTMQLSVRPTSESGRLELMRAMRTWTTADQADVTMAMAYNLGLPILQAENLARRARRDAETCDAAPGAVAVYRHFDDEGQLLYVGITKDVALRNDQHSSSAAWWRFVTDSQVIWCSSRRDAESVEREAIRSERPVFNDTLNRANRSAAIDYLVAQLDRRQP